MPSKEKVRVPVVIVSDHICDQVKEVVAQWAAQRGYKTQVSSRVMRLWRGGGVSAMREILLKCRKDGTRMEIEFHACVRSGSAVMPVGSKSPVPATQRGILERTEADRSQVLKTVTEIFPEAKLSEREAGFAARRLTVKVLVVGAALFLACAVIGWFVVQRWILH